MRNEHTDRIAAGNRRPGSGAPFHLGKGHAVTTTTSTTTTGHTRDGHTVTVTVTDDAVTVTAWAHHGTVPGAGTLRRRAAAARRRAIVLMHPPRWGVDAAGRAYIEAVYS